MDAFYRDPKRVDDCLAIADFLEENGAYCEAMAIRASTLMYRDSAAAVNCRHLFNASSGAALPTLEHDAFWCSALGCERVAECIRDLWPREAAYLDGRASALGRIITPHTFSEVALASNARVTITERPMNTFQPARITGHWSRRQTDSIVLESFLIGIKEQVSRPTPLDVFSQTPWEVRCSFDVVSVGMDMTLTLRNAGQYTLFGFVTILGFLHEP
jgi:hypothetical protein